MAVKISALPEATQLDDDDIVPATDVSAPQTKKITVANLRASLLTPSGEIQSGNGATIWVHQGLFVVGAGDLETGLEGTIFFNDGKITSEGVDLEIRAGGGKDLELGAGDGDEETPGGAVVITGGDGEGDTDGGDVVIDGGGVSGSGSGTGGVVRIGTGSTRAIESGGGDAHWTHDGDLTVTGDVAADDVVASGGVSAGQVMGTVISGGVRVTVETETGTARIAADADTNKLILCDNASPITITVPSGLTPGTRIEYAQVNTGQVQIVAGDGVSLITPTGFDPATAAGGAVAVLTVIASNAALVRGDLEETP